VYRCSSSMRLLIPWILLGVIGRPRRLGERAVTGRSVPSIHFLKDHEHAETWVLGCRCL
jgi:hypothetical protein